MENQPPSNSNVGVLREEKQGVNQFSIDQTGRFSGKTVVITGSGTGIGQAIAKRFASEGATIIIMGRRREPLDNTLEVLNNIISSARSSGKAVAYPGVDVSDEVGISSMFSDIKEKFAKVDIVVNNAGVSGPVKTFTNASTKEFRECVAIHLTGAFWTSVNALKIMGSGGKIITISTFFSEENRFEQRPYRFRTPYTAAQGAKNRLAEVLAWELASNDIRSIATNPGPVHSDRIYKTVYPKAAAEFLRIGGFPGLTSHEVEVVTHGALHALGEPDIVVNESVKKVATEIASARGRSEPEEIDQLAKLALGALEKIGEIAEKIQNNTSKMIVDGKFLSQDDVAEMVTTLCDDRISSLINGRVIPNDRVFYPVKPSVGTVATSDTEAVSGKVIVLTTSSSAEKEIMRIKRIADRLQSQGTKQVIAITCKEQDTARLTGIHAHTVNLLEEEAVHGIFNIARTRFGQLDGIIHFTGDYDYDTPFSSMSRAQWDKMVEDFIFIPGLVTREATNVMAPQGATQEPDKYKGTNGTIIIVGPDAPTGNKISGIKRARSDVFRGALRPYTATVNQELSDVLNSNIRLFLILCGSIDGQKADPIRLEKSIVSPLSREETRGNESVFYIDESVK